MNQKSQPYKEVEMAPLTGPLDARSSPNDVPYGGWRMVQNMEVRQLKRLFRSSGWQKLLSTTGYNNQDLHDQTLAAGGDSQITGVKEPIVFLREFTTTGGFTKLIAGTAHRLYELNNAIGNWRIISDDMGEGLDDSCNDFGWVADQVGDTVIFSNGSDKLVYYILEGPTDPATGQAVSQVDDLDKIGISSAKVVVAVKGIMILLNIVQEGLRKPMGFATSDINRPLSWTPLENESTAISGEIDGVGEFILAAKPIADSILIYTNTSIWEMSLAGDLTTILNFRRRYSGGKDGVSCLAYKNTLVQVGSDHYYLGRDGIYMFNLHSVAPERVEWMHRASYLIFSNINSAACNAHVGAYDAIKKTLYFSWAVPGSLCPTKTLTLNTEYGFSSLVDHGFTALTNYHPDNPKTIRDWILENCICSAEGLVEAGFGFVKEGGYCIEPEAVECDSYPTNIYSDTDIVVDGITVEDYTQPEPSPGSLCDILDGMTAQDLCDEEITKDECQAEQSFIGVSAADGAIKEFADVYYREKVTGFTPCGVWAYDGYKSIIRTGALDFKDPQNAKNIGRLILEAFAEDAESPSSVVLRVGAAFQAADSNLDKCSLVWHPQPPKLLQCVSDFDGEAHRVANTRPGLNVEWPLHVENQYLFFELSIDGVGGAASFSRVGMLIRKKGRY